MYVSVKMPTPIGMSELHFIYVHIHMLYRHIRARMRWYIATG